MPFCAVTVFSSAKVLSAGLMSVLLQDANATVRAVANVKFEKNFFMFKKNGRIGKGLLMLCQISVEAHYFRTYFEQIGNK